ncbi:hypothetical protein OSCT_2707 [Oscillochloris trichoides DG-6]|uniref:N-acetyltransferase domain-containing protein n=1 Tax=Oscillochloris trichoides DG-6 TaxID=765420 RepID=E1IHA6_9CHLR|nr:hypothetical protein [Oscillochloris trichoides]EFO79581.1 hypothetical protein OSCT_2707 [Oscillochloris trichoides DG-6]
MSITIRPVTGYAEYTACEALQRVVWPDSVVPLNMLYTAQNNGGVVLGAFDEATPGTPLVGFVFGFMGRDGNNPIKHCSHMAAVLPNYRDTRIGERLKLAQRDAVVAQGIEVMTWTFDPLLSRNARLNIRKLGGITRTYKDNVYGPDPVPDDQLPSDRFVVEWWLNAPRVLTRLSHPEQAPSVAELLEDSILLNPDPMLPSLPIQGKRLVLRIPSQIDALRESDFARAKAWRGQLRMAAKDAFDLGYHIADFASDEGYGYYLLVHEPV